MLMYCNLWPKFNSRQYTTLNFTVCGNTALIYVGNACSEITAINAKLIFYGIPKHYKPTV